MGATAQVLRGLPVQDVPELIVGSEGFDDAGVYRLDAERALVLTVDFFPPLVDDPYPFGRIAAANSLSDVYAMGGRPLTALNIVGFPDDDLPIEILSEILRGGAERVSAAGAALVGGHSVRDGEVKYGLAVTGIVHPDRIITNAGAKEGDVLVLTKPIGSGVLTSAAKTGKIDAADLQEALDVMTALNAGASEAMQQTGVHAATDVTGFGLIGHAFELAQASGVTVELHAATVPLLSGTLELARKKQLTRAWKGNLEHLGDALQVSSGVEEMLVRVLADAQTSGGLLIAVPPDRVDGLLHGLRTRNTPAAVIVGSVSPRGGQAVVLR
ncbi:MAG: selenide, water dikinase SelD [Planctomycetota bacterium]|nr:MAG: selenide, water dikinase SelD [Planctomycetota bacterium]